MNTSISILNYSPRLIETVIKLWRPDENSSFYHFFIDMLEHPNKLWEHAFCRKISPAARDLLLLLCPIQKAARLSDLKCWYTGYHQHKSRIQNLPMGMTDFNDALKETEGTFIRIDGSQVSYHNPSIRDFIHDYIKENDEEFKILCEGAADFDFCIHLINLDQDLCRTHLVELAAALRKTVDRNSSSMLAKQIGALYSTDLRLKSREIRRIIQYMMELFLDQLEWEYKKLSKTTWSVGVTPSRLDDLLHLLEYSKYGSSLVDRACAVFSQYALTWFNWALVYDIEDFLMFRTLHRLRPFPVNTGKFQKVYAALENYESDFAWDDLNAIHNEEDCESYRDEIENLAEFFGIDLSGVICQIDNRIYELEETKGYDSDDDWIRGPAPAHGAGDQEILNMFQCLLK